MGLQVSPRRSCGALDWFSPAGRRLLASPLLASPGRAQAAAALGGAGARGERGRAQAAQRSRAAAALELLRARCAGRVLVVARRPASGIARRAQVARGRRGTAPVAATSGRFLSSVATTSHRGRRGLAPGSQRRPHCMTGMVMLAPMLSLKKVPRHAAAPLRRATPRHSTPLAAAACRARLPRTVSSYAPPFTPHRLHVRAPRDARRLPSSESLGPCATDTSHPWRGCSRRSCRRCR